MFSLVDEGEGGAPYSGFLCDLNFTSFHPGYKISTGINKTNSMNPGILNKNKILMVKASNQPRQNCING